MSTNRPSWPHSAVEVLQQINAALLARLNGDVRPGGGLWTVETGQLNLSKPGGLRIVWSILGGPIQRGAQYQGPYQPAKCIAVRQCRLQAEIRLNKGAAQQVGAVGIAPDDIQTAEEVIRALCVVWNQLRPADFDEDLQEEQWDKFNEDPGQREIVCQYRVTPLLLVLRDPYLFKQIDSIDTTGVPVLP